MECRKALILCLGLLVPLAGCVPPLNTLRPGDSAEKVGEEVAKKPGTFVAFGDFRASASFAPENAPDLQQTYREEARLAYLRAIEIEPMHVPAYLALARLQQACKDHAGAMATYQRALEITARDANLWYELGMCQARQKLFAEAVGSLIKACELNPGNKQLQTTLGYTLARAGRWGDGLATLSSVVGEARAYYDLGRLLNHTNQTDMACQYLAAALARDPNLPGCREALENMGSARVEGPNIVAKPIQTTPVAAIRTQPAPPATVTRTATTDESGPGPLLMQASHQMATGSEIPIRLPPPPVLRIRSSDH